MLRGVMSSKALTFTLALVVQFDSQKISRQELKH